MLSKPIEVEFLAADYINAYNAFCAQIFEEWQPAGPTEKRLVRLLAECKWQGDRAKARKRAVYTKTLTGEPLAIAQVKILTELQQLGSRFQRDYQNTLKLLERLQADRKQRRELQEQL
jgi:hypothetical protein